VRFGILPPYRTGVTVDPTWMTAFARAAEGAGFESLLTVEHVVVPAGYASRYPYSETGRMPLPDDCDIPDPLELLAFLAARTERIRLGTGIIVLPEHHPVQLAKRAATIDRLSGGRLFLGVGVGWLREEVEAVGVDFDTRGARTDESVTALRALWTEDEPTFSGAHFRFERARSHPKPVQPSIPIHVGGHSVASARRAGRLGDGWFPLGVDDALLPVRLEQLRRAAGEAGRDAAAIELTLGGLLGVVGEPEVERAAAHGATRVVLSTRSADLAELTDLMATIGALG
jgi:probable F420-dependent oxidoreductase